MVSANSTLVMGILNITPDSFADGGKYFSQSEARKRLEEMIAEEVDIIDIGGESTRPGADRVSEEEENRRVMPVVREALALGAVVSVDTTRATIAEAAITAGAHYINDVSGGLSDSRMAKVIADSKVKYVAMHWRAPSAKMMEHSHYHDVVTDVKNELAERVEALITAGVKKNQLIVDPGIGFSKLPIQNWELLRGIDSLAELNFPILIGASRKRFLGETLTPEEREDASVAVTAFCATKGVWAVRTHSVKPHKEAIAQVARLQKVYHG